MRDTPLAALCWQLALLSLVAVGGANSVVPDIHRFVVDVEHLMTSDEFARWFALAQAAPGPNVLIVALIGWKVAGVLGAVLALASMCAPSCVMTYVLSQAWDRFRGRPGLRRSRWASRPSPQGSFWRAGTSSVAGPHRSEDTQQPSSRPWSRSVAPRTPFGSSVPQRSPEPWGLPKGGGPAFEMPRLVR